MRTCSECPANVHPSRRHVCSATCRERRRRRLNREAYVPLETRREVVRVCECGREFRARVNECRDYSGPWFCSDACREQTQLRVALALAGGPLRQRRAAR